MSLNRQQHYVYSEISRAQSDSPKVAHRPALRDGEWVPACGVDGVGVSLPGDNRDPEWTSAEGIHAVPHPNRKCRKCFGGSSR